MLSTVTLGKGRSSFRREEAHDECESPITS
jgi:hypothetical protein